MTKRRAEGAWVITGAASGFGRRYAQVLAEKGERLALWDRDRAGLERTTEELAGGSPHLEEVDVTDPDAARRAAERSAEALGPIGHVIHCAGILRVGGAMDVSASDYRAMMEVNYLGSVHVAQALLPHLRRSGSRRRPSTLVFVASVAALRGLPQLAGYCASKSAVLGFAEALRDETSGEGVDIRVLCPPAGETPMVRDLPKRPPIYKLSRLHSAEEVVSATFTGLRSKDFVILVDPGSKLLYRLERWAPGVLGAVVRLADRL